MSLTQTTTTTTTTSKMRVEAFNDLQRRLQPPPSTASASSGGASSVAGQQLRFRAAMPPTPTPTAAPARNATLARRFSFVWPFISKENAGTEPFLKSRCSQLLRQFPAFLGGRRGESTLNVRDLISRALTQLKAVWLVLAVYLSLLVLTCLCSAVLYAFLLAKKPLGLWFLVGCVAATGAIAGVSFSSRERPKKRRPQQQQQQQPQQAQQQQPQQQQAQPLPRISIN